MNSILVRSFVLLFLLSSLFSCTRRDGEYVVELISVNDVHGRFFDSLYVGNGRNISSLANFSSFLKEKRSEFGPDRVIVIDGGDAIEGDNSVYYANYVDTLASGKHLMSRIAEYLGYDAMVVGNHDIQAGHPVYDKIVGETDIPYLAANAVDVVTGRPYFAPYVILDKGGVKVAVIGMTNPCIKKWLGEDLWSGLEFYPIEKSIDSLVSVVRSKERADIVVLAIHAGLGDGSGNDVENPARYLASNLKGIDIVLSSHDHKLACEKIFNGVDSVLVLNAGSRCSHVSNASIKLVFNRGELVSKSVEGEIIPLEKYPVDYEYTSQFREDFLKTKAFTNQVIGKLERPINAADAFFGPSEYISLIHSVQLSQSGADISFAAPLTYSGYIDSGEIVYNDLFTIYPFDNELYVISLTGEQVLKCLEYSYDKWTNTMNSPADHIMKIRYKSGSEHLSSSVVNSGQSGGNTSSAVNSSNSSGGYSFVYPAYNFDSAGGLEYDVDVREPYGNKIKIKGLTDGRPFDLNATYKVAMTSFRANGGGDLLTKGAGIPREHLASIIVAKHKDIRSMIYDFYKSGNASKQMVSYSWKFIPEYFVQPAIARDRALLFAR